MQTKALPAAAHATDRIVVIDVLRAFALFGIIVTHSATGFLAGPAPNLDFMTFTALDRAVGRFELLFSFGKFYTIFSFLFGLSFALQINNAARRDAAFAGRFSWRLIVLLIIGCVHGMFFSGDVLIVYALLGLLLIPLRGISNRTLLIIAFILVLNLPMLLLGIASVSAPADPAAAQAQAAQVGQFMQMAQRQVELKQSGTLLEVIQLNLTFGLRSKMLFMIFTGRLWITFGLFLLGLYAGRLNLFEQSELNRLRFARLLRWTGIVALITTVIAVFHPASMQAATLADVLFNASFTLQQISLSAFYVAAVTLLFWSNPQGRLLPALAPAGKMGLTTYLTQTAFGLLVFYGFGLGLMGRIGVAAAVGLAVAFYIVQIFASRWWLRHFNMGPFEWLWRSLTWFELKPNVRRLAVPRSQ